MKRILSTLITISIISVFLPVVSHAEKYEDLFYDPETGAITGYSLLYEGETWDLVIPSVIDGVKITAIADNALDENDKLTSVTIPEGVTSIGRYAFAGCRNLTKVELPSTLETIGESAFSGCPFEEIDLPTGLKSIGNATFYNCNNLKSITVPNTVENIEYGAFMYAPALESIWVTVGNDYYTSDTSGVLFNKDMTELIKYPPGNTRHQYAIPGSVKKITNNAFQFCDNLQSVNLPYGLETIGGLAFDDCDHIQTMNIPSSVTKIEGYAFNSCDNLNTLSISDTLKTIDDMAFYECNSLTDIYFTGNYKKWNPSIGFGNDAFKNANYTYLTYIPDFELKNISYEKSEDGANKYIKFDTSSNIEEWTYFDVYAAVYSADGVLKECRSIADRILIEYGEETHYVYLWDFAESGDIVKAFAWDDDGKPLAASISAVVE